MVIVLVRFNKARAPGGGGGGGGAGGSRGVVAGPKVKVKSPKF